MEISPTEAMVVWPAATLAFALWASSGTLNGAAGTLLTVLVLLAVLAVALHRCVG